MNQTLELRLSPLISVGLPVYNGENFVAQAIRSILDQDFDNFELVISDNASTDGTAEICRAFAARDRRIRYFRNERNIGAAANYNRAFELSSGEFFKWCAHDDFVSRNFLRAGIAALQQDPEAVVAYGRLVSVDMDGHIIPQAGEAARHVSVPERTFPDMRDMTPARRFQMLVDAGGSDNAMFGVMRATALGKTSLHRKYYMSDRALLAELAMLGIFVQVPGSILYNRDHPSRSTKIPDKLARTVWTNPSIRSKRCFEHLALLSQQIEIACRYRHTAPLYSTLPRLALWASHPFRLSCYALEIIGIAFPDVRHALGRTALRARDTLHGALKALVTGNSVPPSK